jgi:lambda family phage tail tape measure protein
MDIEDTRDFAAEARDLNDILAGLEARSNAFGSALAGALKSATVSGKSLDDVLRGLATRLSTVALNSALKPLETLVSNAAGSLTAGLGSLFGFADGGVVHGVTPFAAGGIVSQPTYFAHGGGLGLMGEAGAEAILPLKRGSDGSLGVAAAGGGATQIVFNVTANDAASFRKSEAQISAMLARTVSRGQRNT